MRYTPASAGAGAYPSFGEDEMAGKRVSPWILVALLAVVLVAWFAINFMSVRA